MYRALRETEGMMRVIDDFDFEWGYREEWTLLE